MRRCKSQAAGEILIVETPESCVKWRGTPWLVGGDGSGLPHRWGDTCGALIIQHGATPVYKIILSCGKSILPVKRAPHDQG